MKGNSDTIRLSGTNKDWGMNTMKKRKGNEKSKSVQIVINCYYNTVSKLCYKTKLL